MYVYDANFYHKIPDIPVIFLNPSIELTPVLVAKDLFDRALQVDEDAGWLERTGTAMVILFGGLKQQKYGDSHWTMSPY